MVIQWRRRYCITEFWVKEVISLNKALRNALIIDIISRNIKKRINNELRKAIR